MNHSFPEEKRKIKKPHFCQGCGDKIHPGPNVEMFHWSGVSDDGFWAAYLCVICEAFYRKFHPDLSEGFGEGEFACYDEYKQFKEHY